MNDIIIAPASIGKISTLKNRTIRAQLDISKEISPEEMVTLFNLSGTHGSFAYKSGTITDADIALLPDVVLEVGDKPPSQRLRNVLFRLWENTGKVGTSNDHYVSMMGKIIEHYKGKIPV